MDSSHPLIAAWSFGLAGTAYTAFALQLARTGHLRAEGGKLARLLVAAIAASAAWAWFGAADPFASTVVFIRLGAAADLLRYALWFALLLGLLRPEGGARLPVGVSWLQPVVVTALVVAALLQVGVALHVGGLEPQSRAVQLGWLTLALLALVLVEQVYRNADESSLWNLKPLCLGLAGGFLFDAYQSSDALLFGAVDADAAVARGGVHALMVPLLLLSTLRRRDWGTGLQLSRKVAFHSATLLVAGAYLMFVSGVGYYVRVFGGEWGRALQVGLVFVALIGLLVLALSGSTRARLRVFVGKHFFRYRFDYRDEWLRFTQTLSAQASPQQMGQQVIRGLADMLESPGGALWLKLGAEGAYRQSARWNQPACTEPEEQGASLAGFMARTGWVINLEEYRAAPRRYDGLELPAWLTQLPQAWLIVPLCVGEDLIGFVVLAGARTPVEVNWEVNDLLKTAGRQAASFLAQMQATEALLEARKFDAFNRMSAFVVHDLKNIVTQLSLMMKNARRLQDNPEFRADMLMTIENSLEKMRQLMLQLREGATPPGAALGVDLGRVAQRIAANAVQRGRKLEVAPQGGRVFTRGHEDRLERVIGHVVQNAFDATDADGRVWLNVTRQAGQACVEVGDTGQGMTPEFVRERLFKPFQSTKSAGMGIGAYESFQYVQELGGSVKVDSEPGRGTLVKLLLPLFEAPRDSDLQMLEAS